MKVSYSPVKELAVSKKTPVFQPETLKDGKAAKKLKDLKCDLLVVVAYGKILTRDILDAPLIGCINIHGSLLPKYRGAAPIQWAVLNGDKETGVTSQFVTQEVDSGDIIFTMKTDIGDDDTSGTVYDKLSVLGAELLSKTVSALSKGEVVRIPQNHEEATYAPQLSKEMSQIDWNDTAHNIKNKVRGLNPWPVATTELNGTVYKVFKVEVGSGKTNRQPGEIVSTGRNGLEIACADGTVVIKELQTPGGRRMEANDYLRGHNII